MENKHRKRHTQLVYRKVERMDTVDGKLTNISGEIKIKIKTNHHFFFALRERERERERNNQED